jgi:hypothetical protein
VTDGTRAWIASLLSGRHREPGDLSETRSFAAQSRPWSALFGLWGILLDPNAMGNAGKG